VVFCSKWDTIEWLPKENIIPRRWTRWPKKRTGGECSHPPASRSWTLGGESPPVRGLYTGYPVHGIEAPNSAGQTIDLTCLTQPMIGWSCHALPNSTHGLDLEGWTLFNPSLTSHGTDIMLIHGLPRPQATERLEYYSSPIPWVPPVCSPILAIGRQNKQ
jgi:hypothetical protein